MQIYNHDTPETIVFKINFEELDNWVAHFQYIDKEIRNLLNLAKNELSEVFKNQSVLDKLMWQKKENETALLSFLKYKETMPKAAECEDADCDMFYISEHERFRGIYLAELNKYRKVKEEFFNALGK